MIDWSDVSKLKFRNNDGKIIEALVPKNEKSLSKPYPVVVFYQDKNTKICSDTYTIDGFFDLAEAEGSGERDVIQKLWRIKKAPMTFWEIVKLIYDNEGLLVSDGESIGNICKIDIDNETFKIGIVHYEDVHLCNDFKYSTDVAKTWCYFEKEEL